MPHNRLVWNQRILQLSLGDDLEIYVTCIILLLASLDDLMSSASVSFRQAKLEPRVVSFLQVSKIVLPEWPITKLQQILGSKYPTGSNDDDQNLI